MSAPHRILVLSTCCPSDAAPTPGVFSAQQVRALPQHQEVAVNDLIRSSRLPDEALVAARVSIRTRCLAVSRMREPELPVTFIIAAYNAEDTIAAAIDSVFRQRGPEYELVVVDDGSSDSTLQVAESLARGRTDTVVLSRENSGTAGALNAGLARARGGYVVRLDADDELDCTYLQLMYEYVLANPDYDIYAPDLWLLRPDGLRHRVFGWRTTRSVSLSELILECQIPGAGTMVKRWVFECLDGYRTGVHSEDYDLWLRALAAGARHVYVPKPLYLYKQGAGQKTGNAVAVHESNAEILRHLIDSGGLTHEETTAARDAEKAVLMRLQEIKTHGGRTKDEIMADSAAARLTSLRSSLSRVLPDGAVMRLLSGIYALRAVARPVRRAVWWLKFRRRP